MKKFEVSESLRGIGVQKVYEADKDAVMTDDEFSAYKELIDNLPVAIRDETHNSGQQERRAGRLHNPVMVRFDPSVNLEDVKAKILAVAKSCGREIRVRKARGVEMTLQLERRSDG